MIVDSIGTERFLRRYWQRRPVLLKQAFPHFRDPITPEELAGLACEADVEARLVHHRRGKWRLQAGPFGDSDFLSLPARNWTLLVQAVDQWVPGVRALLDSVSFLPSWRADDVMISYATPEGGVGPHFDYYDVFLVQGLGSRIWKTGQRCTHKDLLRTDSGLKLLQEFHTEQEWRLDSGDVLYVPPGVAHWGTSLDNSLCYSIGFRAPSASEALLGYAEQAVEFIDDDLRFEDPLRKLPLRAGEITPEDQRQLKRLLRTLLHDEVALASWFGRHMTEPRHGEQIVPATRRKLLKPDSLLCLHPAARMAWQQRGSVLAVFVNGEVTELPVSPSLQRCVELLCGNLRLPGRLALRHRATATWCQQLLDEGLLEQHRLR